VEEIQVKTIYCFKNSILAHQEVNYIFVLIDQANRTFQRSVSDWIKDESIVVELASIQRTIFFLAL